MLLVAFGTTIQRLTIGLGFYPKADKVWQDMRFGKVFGLSLIALGVLLIALELYFALGVKGLAKDLGFYRGSH